YETATPPSISSTPAKELVTSQSVLPSGTPFVYTIKAGDTLGQVAQKFNVKLDALLAANPDVDPNGMTVGKTLNIPGVQKDPTGESVPTPVPFALEEINCHSMADGGLWCFAQARNDSPDILENVTAQITLLNSAGQSVDSRMALLPLNILPPHARLPLSAFFAPGFPSDVHPQVQVLTAIRLLARDPRYLPAVVQNTEVQIDWSGLSAQVSGRIVLPAPSKPASKVWVAAVVYDGKGHIVGVRRWESASGLTAGNSLPFSFSVSGVSGKIEQAEFAVEARP
ncbi:MAG: LysM peptidoglycan-binding domain-containing protein, partial [Anaerolineales bacterium]